MEHKNLRIEIKKYLCKVSIEIYLLNYKQFKL